MQAAKASTSMGVWLTTLDIWRWLQTSFSPGATFRSPVSISGALGSRRFMSAVRVS
jgi:hypothetical protein